ncbi:MAG: alanine racemase [Candidatus Wallbacteria bacterium]|nr:alanine racemase [Candidatus Wallbacteria bacterium]
MLQNIKKPTLLLDKERCLINIRAMADKAKKSQVRLRPHFKTHQSALVGDWIREQGCSQITVSSVAMAVHFTEWDFNDITIAIPLNIRELDEIYQLSEKIKLGVLVESLETIKWIEPGKKIEIWIKVDCGYHRTGVSWEDIDTMDSLLSEIDQRNLKFKGFLTHSGHAYKAGSREEIINLYDETVAKLNFLKKGYLSQYPSLELSTGDTPSCSLIPDFKAVDEVRPGNYVFYDTMQLRLGSCTEEQIAVALAAPVIAIHPERNEFVVYGGAVHLSKEFLKESDGSQNFGLVCPLLENGWGKSYKDTRVSALSQEHGVIRTTTEILKTLKIGDLVAILPVHSCLTADLMQEYLII